MSTNETNTMNQEDIFDDFFGDKPVIDTSKKSEVGETHNDFDYESPKLETQSTVEEKTESDYSPNIDELCDPQSQLPLPNLSGSGSLSKYPKSYVELANRVRQQYKKLPYVDFDAVYDEVEKLAVKSSATPTLQTMNDELQRIQGMKDRLVEIYVNVIKCYNTKKRCTEILQDAWGKYSDEKNAEKRKGDAIMCTNEFLVDLVAIETLMKYCSEIMKNLDSIQETTSRRVTVMQSIMKIDFYSRNALPDKDFKNRDYRNLVEESNLEKTIEESNTDEELKATEVEF